MWCLLSEIHVVQLSAGSIRAKNAKNIILKNLLDACFGAIGWYLFGFGLAYGDGGNGILGEDGFALEGVSNEGYHSWFFQYAVPPLTLSIRGC